MELETIEMRVPKEMVRFWNFWAETDERFRNAMLVYPAIWNGAVTYGKAAEIIGMHKLELMDLYEQLGLPYIDMTRESLHEEIEALKAYWMKERDLDRAKGGRCLGAAR